MSPLRLAFFTLLLANVGFYAWRLNAGPAEGHEPERLQQQIAPEKLTLILPKKPQTAPAAGAEPAPDTPPPSSESANVSNVSNVPNVSDAPAPATAPPAQKADADRPPLLCKSFGGFTPEAAKSAQLAINNSSPHTQVVLIPVRDASSFWVHIPPQKNKSGAEKKVSELKELGVDDSFIISDKGPSQWAVSLGLFRSRETAENYLQKLNKQGVRSARIEERGNSETVRVEVSAPAEALGVLAREIKPLAEATLGDCKSAGDVAASQP